MDSTSILRGRVLGSHHNILIFRFIHMHPIIQIASPAIIVLNYTAFAFILDRHFFYSRLQVVVRSDTENWTYSPFSSLEDQAKAEP